MPDVIVVPIPSDAPSPTCVVVQFIERMMDPVPTADGRSEPSRIEESCDVSLAPGPCDAGVTLARLICEKASWRVDPAFTPTRLFTRRGWVDGITSG